MAFGLAANSSNIYVISPSCLCSSLLQELLEKVVVKTEGYEVYQLEKLYALLCQSIYRHRRHYNKTALVQVSWTDQLM